MRRMLRHVAVALLAVIAVDWAPGIPPLPDLSLAQAQVSTFPAPIGPGGVLWYSNASVTAVNTTTETSMAQWVVTPSLIATASSVGALGSPVYTGTSATGLSTAPLFTTPAPMHFRAIGYLSGAAGTSVNIGVNYGAASVVMANNIAAAQTGAITTNPTPYWLDVWISPIATTSATPASANSALATVYLVARATWINAGATISGANTATLANIVLASPTALNVVAKWAAASNTSNLTFLNRVFVIGQ